MNISKQYYSLSILIVLWTPNALVDMELYWKQLPGKEKQNLSLLLGEVPIKAEQFTGFINISNLLAY